MAKKFIKNIIFSQVPVKGFYRFEDQFQIYPINIENAPNSKKSKHYPLIIEYQYDENEVKDVQPFEEGDSLNKMISHSTHQTNRLIQITNLLSCITNFRFFFYRTPNMYWSVPIPEEITAENKNEINNISSKWSGQLYYYKDMWKDLQINDFKKNNSEPIKLVPRKDYYWYEPISGDKNEIDLPSNIDLILAKYFNLSKEEQKICDSSLHQFCNALDLFNTMKSLSFFAFVSCIETLVNYEFKDVIVEFDCNDCKSIKSSSHQCNKCGKPIWGISAKYREFLFKYVANNIEAKKIYNKIYNIRSQITHTGFLINGDNFIDWDFNDKTKSINIKHLEVMQLCRRAVGNWLIFKK